MKEKYQQIVLDEMKLEKDKEQLLVLAFNKYCEVHATAEVPLPNIIVPLNTRDIGVELVLMNNEDGDWVFYDIYNNQYFESELNISLMILTKIILNQI